MRLGPGFRYIAYPSQLSGHNPWMVQLPLGNFCPCFSRPVQVFQNCVCKTSPPGVGEQQVFFMAVVFSHEKTEGSKTHAERLGKVLGMEIDPGDFASTTRWAKTLATNVIATLVIIGMRQFMGVSRVAAERGPRLYMYARCGKERRTLMRWPCVLTWSSHTSVWAHLN